MRVPAFLMSLALATFSLAASAEDFKLTPKDSRDPKYVDLTKSTAFMLSPIAKSKRTPAFPEGVTRSASLAALSMTDKTQLVFLLDPARVPALYADANRSGDFSDDTRYEGVMLPQAKAVFPLGDSALFGPVAISADGVNGPSIYVEVATGDLVFGYVGKVMAGEAVIGGRKCAVAVYDAGLDGRYGDTYPKSRSCDNIAIDFDGNKTFSAETEFVPLTPMIPFGSEYYAFKVSPDGAVLTVEKASPRLGSATVSEKGAKLLLISANGEYRISGSSKAALPVGDYLVRDISLLGSDAGGKWQIEGGLSPKPFVFTVAEGKTTDIVVGPPLAPRFSASQSGTVVTLQMSGLEGCAGEMYSAAVSKNGASGTPPKFAIFDESGKTIGKGVFEFG